MNKFLRERTRISVNDVRPEDLPVVLRDAVKLAEHAIEKPALKVLMEPLLLRQLTVELSKLPNMQVALQSNGMAIQALPGSQVPLLERKDNNG